MGKGHDILALFAALAAAGILFSASEPRCESPPPSSPTQDLFAAVKAGDLKRASEAITHGADVNGAGKGGMSPLHLAAFKGEREMAGLLLDHGAKVDARDEGGMTPLHAAAFEGKEGTADLLLRRGADPSARDSSGYTPLQYATTNGREDVAALLRTAPERPAPRPPPRIITNEDIAGGGAESGAGFSPGGSRPYSAPAGFNEPYEPPVNKTDSYPIGALQLSPECKRKYGALKEKVDALRRRPSNRNEVDLEKIRRQIEEEEAFLRYLDTPAGSGSSTLRSQAGVAYRPGEDLPDVRYGARLSEEASESERQRKEARDAQARKDHEKKLEELRKLEDQRDTLSPGAAQEIKSLEEEMARVLTTCH
jgi:hypothetical protein